MENPIKMDDLGGFPPIFGLHPNISGGLIEHMHEGDEAKDEASKLKILRYSSTPTMGFWDQSFWKQFWGTPTNNLDETYPLHFSSLWKISLLLSMQLI